MLNNYKDTQDDHKETERPESVQNSLKEAHSNHKEAQSN